MVLFEGVRFCTYVCACVRAQACGCDVPTSLVLSKGDNVLVVIVNESGKCAGHAYSHADLLVVPLPCVSVLLQAHHAPNKDTETWHFTC